MARTDVAILADAIDETTLERRANRRDRWLTFATLEVEWDCRLIAALTTSTGPTTQPTRQPVIA